MKYKNIMTLLAAFAMTATGCSDFLEREPLAQGTEAIFFQNAEQFEQAANEFYNNLDGWKDKNGAGFGFDKGLDISGLGQNGGASAPESDWQWDKRFSYIRQCNILLEKAETYAGSKEEIAASVATARFFRAWHYFFTAEAFWWSSYYGKSAGCK